MLKRLIHILMLAILLTNTIQVLAQNSLPDKVCVGTERHYRVTGNPNSIFTWTINGQIQTSVNNVLNITWSTPGTYTIEVQEYLNNCSGTIKTGIVTVVDIPKLVISKGDLLVWEQSTPQTLNANTSIVPETGINVVWYDQASGGTAIASPTLSQVGTKTYYAEANNGFCSNRLRTPVTLTILPKHVIPTVVSQITNDTSPVITGTATIGVGEILTVSVNGITYTAGDGKLTTTGTNWSLQIPVGSEIMEGTYSVTATVRDALGNSSTDVSSNELVIDLTGPSIPTVNAMVTNDTTPNLTGTSAIGIGEALKVTVNGITYTLGDGKLSLTGTNWSLQIPSGSEILDGIYSVAATITDVGGNSRTDVSSGELIIDTTAPVIPTVVRLTTNDATPLISGTATVALGETLKVTVNGITYSAGDGKLILTGTNWSLQVPPGSEILEGTYNVTAIVTDAAGNSSTDVTNGELIIDTTAPVIPTVARQTTNDNTPVIIGTATVKAGETLKVSVNGNTYSAGDGKLTLTGSNWSLQIPPGNEILDGTYNVTAIVTDAAGNSSTDITNGELIIDTTAPVIPTVASQTTNDNTPVITGTATVKAGETLKVTVNGISYTAGDGKLILTGTNWSLQVPSGNEILDGTYNVTAIAGDAAGNSSTDITNGELIIDTTVPVIPTVASQTTNDNTPVITGTATVKAGETLKVSVNGNTYTAGDGKLTLTGTNWSLQVPFGNEILDGTYNVTAIVTDAAGNSSTDITNGELIIDTTAPVIPTVASQTTNDNTPVITGTATVKAGETLKVSVNGNTYMAGDGKLTLTGTNWSLQVPPGNEILDGTYNVTAIVTDAAGNSSTDITNGELIIDTTVPVIPTVASQTTNDNTPVITGTATVKAGETLKVSVNGNTYTAGDGKLTLTGTNWRLQVPPGNEILDGTYNVTAIVTDAAGNSSTDITNGELIIDTTAPVIPTVASQTTNDNTPVITGTATVKAGETLKVSVNGNTYTAGDGKLTLTGSNWSLQIPPGNEILDGTYNVTAIVTDAAGNSSTDITNGELIIDTTAPVIPTVASQTTNDNTPVITGTATVKAGETLKVSVNGNTYTAGDGKLTLTGSNWSLQVPSGNEILDGTYNVTAIVTDAAGNSTTDQTSNELIIGTKKAPIAVNDVFTTKDITFEGNLALNDIPFEGGQLIYTVQPITKPLKGDVIINSNGTFSYTRNTTASGTDEFVYEVCDNGTPSQCSQAKVIITLSARGPIARIAGAPSLMIGNCNTVGQLLDASASSGNELTYSWLPVLYLDNASSPTPRFYAGVTTRYHLTVTDQEGQKDTASVLVQVADAPKAITDKNVFVDTPNANITLNGAKSTGRSLTYLWLSKEGIILNGETQASARISGLGTYYLQVTDAFGCMAKDSVNVGLYIQAINDTVQTKVNQGVMINVARNDIPRNKLNPSGISIVTAPLHGTATTTADSMVVYQPEELYTGQDQFIYSICDYFGNCDNAKVLVLINDLPFFIPEAFSPNGDGINDQFEIKGLEKYKSVEIEIFNRWGNVVYQSKNYGAGNGKTGFWDGTVTSGMRVGSGPVPSGTYYYILKMNGHENISGAVYLDR